MSISVVNGYLCVSACDAAKARTGLDPHASNAADQNAASDATRSPAVVFGGALADRNTTQSAGAASAAGATRNNPGSAGVDIRV